jgi:SAM-dependent methyltransferase
MGKSDPFVFSWYLKNLPQGPRKIAVLGSKTESFVRYAYPDAKIDLFDIQLKNWDINDPDWKIEKNEYDLVICTRCAYFSKDPEEFISKCFSLVKKDGFVFVDWGYGDHWRFENFKIGWLKDGEHEFAEYEYQKSHLYSGLWKAEWESNEIVQEFKINVQKLGYNNKDIIIDLRNEIPNLLENFSELEKVDFLSLWPEKPQLYILTIFKKKL